MAKTHLLETPYASDSQAATRLDNVFRGDLSVADLQDCSLFNLPAEIRLMIWEFALIADGPLSVMKRVFKPAQRTMSRFGANVDIFSAEHKLSLALPALLAVSRLTRYEGLQTFYANNTFRIKSGDERNALLSAMQAAPSVQKMMSQIGAIAFSLGCIDGVKVDLCAKQTEDGRLFFRILKLSHGKYTGPGSTEKPCLCGVFSNQKNLPQSAKERPTSLLMTWVSEYPVCTMMERKAFRHPLGGEACEICQKTS